MGYYRLHVQLNEDNPQDQVVIAALERLGDRGKSRWVRQVLFDAINEPARAEILEAIRGVKRAIEDLEVSGIPASASPQQGSDEEPAQAASNLDGMLDRLAGW
jgi:hypothetical protein